MWFKTIQICIPILLVNRLCTVWVTLSISHNGSNVVTVDYV